MGAMHDLRLSARVRLLQLDEHSAALANLRVRTDSQARPQVTCGVAARVFCFVFFPVRFAHVFCPCVSSCRLEEQRLLAAGERLEKVVGPSLEARGPFTMRSFGVSTDRMLILGEPPF